MSAISRGFSGKMDGVFSKVLRPRRGIVVGGEEIFMLLKDISDDG